MNILICEDEEIMLTALEFRLRKHGFKIIKAANGEQALAKIEQGSADLVIADVLTPLVSGLELVIFLRRTMSSNLPIIIMATPAEHDDLVLQALRAGANDFISKPFKPDELTLRIRRVMQDVELQKTVR